MNEMPQPAHRLSVCMICYLILDANTASRHSLTHYSPSRVRFRTVAPQDLDASVECVPCRARTTHPHRHIEWHEFPRTAPHLA